MASTDIPPSALILIQAAADREEVTLEAVLSGDQYSASVVARHRAWRALRAKRRDDGSYRYTLARIGGWFGVSHSAVHSAVRRNVNHVSTDCKQGVTS